MTKQTDLFSYLLVFTLFTGLYDTATADDAAQVIRITLKDGKVLEYRKDQVVKSEVVEDGKVIESVLDMEAGERAMDWLRSCRVAELKAAMAATAGVLVVGERDSRLVDGKPVRPNVWGVRIVKEKADIEKLLQGMTAERKGNLTIESVRTLQNNTLPGVSATVLGEHLPTCRYLVTVGNDEIDDVLDFYVDAQGHIVGLVGVER